MPKTVKTAVIGIITTAALIMPLAFAGPASAAESTAPTITEFTVSSATFYPTDHDGYPDGVTFNGRASVGTSRLQPFLFLEHHCPQLDRRHDRRGQRPRAELLGGTWEWDGKDLNGIPVPVGTYTATLTVTNPETSEQDDTRPAGRLQAGAAKTTPVIRQFTASPTTFFPTVRDGSRDGVTFNGWSDIIDTEEWVSQTWNITIRNASGGKVAERNGVDPDWEDAHWSWKGLVLNGNSVRVGTYAATFTVTNTTTGEIDTARRTLTATSDTIYRRSIKSHRGVNTSARSHSANCYIDPAWYKAGSLELDCWGGQKPWPAGQLRPAEWRPQRVLERDR